MSMTALQLALAYQTLNDPAVIEKFGSMRSDMYAQSLFDQGGNLDPDVNDLAQIAKWQEYSLSRKPAPYTGRVSPAVALEGVDQALKTSPLADIKVASQPVPVGMLSSVQAARNWLAVQIKDLRKRLAIAKELFAWQALKGSVAINNSTVPGSKVSFAMTFAVTDLTPAASWDTAGTPILSNELPLFAQTYHDACGLQIRRYVIDKLTKGQIRKNTEVQGFVQNAVTPEQRLLAMNTVMGPAFGGFELDEYRFDVHSTKYDLSGTLTKYLGDKAAIALPDDSELSMVLGKAEGYGDIPREAIGMSLEGQGGLAPNRGDYAYAYTTPNPATAVLVLGCRLLYVLTFPKAVGYCDDTSST